MNNKEFITRMASRTGLSAKEVARLTEAFCSELADQLDDGDALSIKNFGTLEVRKKLERIVINPATRQRMLVPPKLALSFKPSATLKDKFK